MGFIFRGNAISNEPGCLRQKGCITIRYDPRDLAVIRVFYHERFLCRAVCPELAGQQISLKEVIQARIQQRKRGPRGDQGASLRR